MRHPHEIIKELLPDLFPTIVALAVASLVVLISCSFQGMKKVAFQVVALSALAAASISYLVATDNASLRSFWSSFAGLSFEARLCISILAVVASYFGAGLYVVAPEKAEYHDTPASIDTSVGFSVPAVLPESDLALFKFMLTKLSDEIISDLPTTYEMPDEAVAWVKRMIEYTVDGGKMNRGLAVMTVQKTFGFSKGRELTTKERLQSAALGWCVEFLQAFFLVADDVMDSSINRRGQPCWYRLPDVKLISINDSFLLESFVFKILKKYFGDQPAVYGQLLDLFLEVTRQTELGQLLDLTSQKLGGPIDLSRFTLDRYISIVKYKTAFYSFYLPVALGMITAGITKRSTYDEARTILLIMGEYFQIQDDFLDNFGDPKTIGKIGTDIQDNKCSWLVVQALKLSTPAQRRVLEENYGRDDKEAIARVKALYDQLNLRKVFEDYEEQSYTEIQALLAKVTDVPSEVFEFLLGRIYKRSK